MPLDEEQRRRRRNRRLLTAAALGTAAATVAYVGWSCNTYGACNAVGELLGVATCCVAMMMWFLLPGSDRVVLDDQGLAINRRRVPWAGVRSIKWVYEADRLGPGSMVEIGLQQASGYRPPRARYLRFDPDDLEVTPAEFWAAVQERTPHRVLVLNTPPTLGTQP